MKYVVTALLLALAASVQAQKKKKQDVTAIKSMCGCYKVSFNYSETFSPDKDYEYHDNYSSGGLEYVVPIEESKDKISLQHLLVINDSMVIKHWRQDWLYQNTDFLAFDKKTTWNYTSKPAAQVKGQWTQKVYQVDDSPRYEGSASWVHVDGRHFWENDTDAPLPRREYTKRSDYNVMRRGNRHEITDFGWVHEQDNDKILRENGEDKLLAKEKGMNIYTKVDDSQCQPAKDWWQRNKAYWADVRSVWAEVFEQKQTVDLEMMKEGQVLYMRLFALGEQQEPGQYESETAKAEIRKIIQKHLLKFKT